MKNLNKRTRFAIYILLTAGLLVSCNNSGEFGKSVIDFLSSPVTEMSVGDLVIILLIIGFITK